MKTKGKLQQLISNVSFKPIFFDYKIKTHPIDVNELLSINPKKKYTPELLTMVK